MLLWTNRNSELIDRCFGSSLPLFLVALAFHRLRFLTVSSWTQATGGRNDRYHSSGLLLCQKAIARIFLFVFFHPQDDYCNKSTAGVCKFNQAEEETHLHYLVSVRETVFGFVFGSFTVGEVFACTSIFLFNSAFFSINVVPFTTSDMLHSTWISVGSSEFKSREDDQLLWLSPSLTFITLLLPLQSL